MAVARALVTGPALLLADEPTGNLDSHVDRRGPAVLDRLNAAGRTVVLITHEDDVAGHAQRLIRLRRRRRSSRTAVRPVADRPPRGRAREARVSMLETVRFALRGLGANKLRSGLTMLGILIGVGAVILLVAVGNGSARRSSGDRGAGHEHADRVQRPAGRAPARTCRAATRA